MGSHDIYRYFNSDKQEYTFWDYQAGSWQKNNGMRIDHFLVSNNLINAIKRVDINKYKKLHNNLFLNSVKWSIKDISLRLEFILSGWN